MDLLTIEYPVKKVFLLILYENERVKEAVEIFHSLKKQSSSQFFIFSANDNKNSFFLNEYMNFNKQSLFIITKEKKDFKKYKLDYDPDNLQLELMTKFLEDFKNNQVGEYLKSKCPEQEEEKTYEGLQVICAYQIEQLIAEDKKPKIVIFHEGVAVPKTKYIIMLMKENIVEKLGDTKVYLYNVFENEQFGVENKIFPYVRMYLNGDISQTKGINFTFDKENYEYFFREYLTEDL